MQNTKSDYWKDVLRNQWLLALQGIAIIIVIFTIGTWMGQECKDNVVNDVPVLVESWRSAIEQLKETILDVGPKLRYCYKTIIVNSNVYKHFTYIYQSYNTFCDNM